MPVSTAAGRRWIATRAPVCKPTPVVLIAFFSVRCLIMVVVAPGASRGAAEFIRRVKVLAYFSTLIPAAGPPRDPHCSRYGATNEVSVGIVHLVSLLA